MRHFKTGWHTPQTHGYLSSEIDGMDGPDPVFAEGIAQTYEWYLANPATPEPRSSDLTLVDRGA